MAKRRYYGWTKFSGEETWLVAIGTNRESQPIYRAESLTGPLTKTRLMWPGAIGRYPAGAFSDVADIERVDLSVVEEKWGKVPTKLRG